ncbi:MAG: TrmB family transcriptional regulator [Candidatus Bathyarchaeia archaeon]
MGWDIEAKLRLLGFSPKEARVYLTLVKLGKADAKTLAQYTNVSRSIISQMLEIFQKLGIVKKTTDPLVYKATPVDQTISMLMAQKVSQKKTRDDTKNLFDELKQNQLFKLNLPEFEFNLSLISATEISVQKRKQLVQNAQGSIDVISSWKNYRFLLKSNFNLLTKNAIDRNVRYRFIIETPNNVKLPPEHADAIKLFDKNCSEFKYLPLGSSAIMSIYDKQEVFMSTSVGLSSFNAPMLWSNNKALISIGKSYFENTWKTASKQPL